MFIFLFFIPHVIFAQESITLTSYYPAPFGAYNRVRFVPTNTPPDCSSAAHQGTVFFNDTIDELQVCNDIGGGVFQFVPLSSIGASVWTQNSDDIYPTDTSSNPNLRVGINTLTPQAVLDVNGRVLVSNGNSLDVTGPLTVTAADPFLIFHDANSAATYNRMYLIGREGSLAFQAADQNLTSWAPIALILDTVNNRVLFPSGNVGVGTAAPSSKLEVAGALKINYSGETMEIGKDYMTSMGDFTISAGAGAGWSNMGFNSAGYGQFLLFDDSLNILRLNSNVDANFGIDVKNVSRVRFYNAAGTDFGEAVIHTTSPSSTTCATRCSQLGYSCMGAKDAAGTANWGSCTNTWGAGQHCLCY